MEHSTTDAMQSLASALKALAGRFEALAPKLEDAAAALRARRVPSEELVSALEEARRDFHAVEKAVLGHATSQGVVPTGPTSATTDLEVLLERCASALRSASVRPLLTRVLCLAPKPEFTLPKGLDAVHRSARELLENLAAPDSEPVRDKLASGEHGLCALLELVARGPELDEERSAELEQRVAAALQAPNVARAAALGRLLVREEAAAPAAPQVPSAASVPTRPAVATLESASPDRSAAPPSGPEEIAAPPAETAGTTPSPALASSAPAAPPAGQATAVVQAVPPPAHKSLSPSEVSSGGAGQSAPVVGSRQRKLGRATWIPWTARDAQAWRARKEGARFALRAIKEADFPSVLKPWSSDRDELTRLIQDATDGIVMFLVGLDESSGVRVPLCPRGEGYLAFRPWLYPEANPDPLWEVVQPAELSRIADRVLGAVRANNERTSLSARSLVPAPSSNAGPGGVTPSSESADAPATEPGAASEPIPVPPETATPAQTSSAAPSATGAPSLPTSARISKMGKGKTIESPRPTTTRVSNPALESGRNERTAEIRTPLSSAPTSVDGSVESANREIEGATALRDLGRANSAEVTPLSSSQTTDGASTRAGEADGSDAHSERPRLESEAPMSNLLDSDALTRGELQDNGMDEEASLLQSALLVVPSLDLPASIRKLPAAQRLHPVVLKRLAAVCATTLPLDEISLSQSLLEVGGGESPDVRLLVCVDSLAASELGEPLDAARFVTAFHALVDDTDLDFVPLAALVLGAVHAKASEVVDVLEARPELLDHGRRRGSRWPALARLLSIGIDHVLKHRGSLPAVRANTPSPSMELRENLLKEIIPAFREAAGLFQPGKMSRRNEFLQAAWTGLLDEIRPHLEQFARTVDSRRGEDWADLNKRLVAPWSRLKALAEDRAGETLVSNAEKVARKQLAGRPVLAFYREIEHHERPRWKERIARVRDAAEAVVRTCHRLAEFNRNEHRAEGEVERLLREAERDSRALATDLTELARADQMLYRFTVLGLMIVGRPRSWTWIPQVGLLGARVARSVDTHPKSSLGWLRPTTALLARVVHDLDYVPVEDLVGDLVEAALQRLTGGRDSDVRSGLVKLGALGAAARYYQLTPAERVAESQRWELRLSQLGDWSDRLEHVGEELVHPDERENLAELDVRAKAACLRDDAGREYELRVAQAGVLAEVEGRYTVSFERDLAATRAALASIAPDVAMTTSRLLDRAQDALGHRKFLLARRLLTVARRVTDGTQSLVDIDKLGAEPAPFIERWPERSESETAALHVAAKRLQSLVNRTATAKQSFDKFIDGLAQKLGVPRVSSVEERGPFYIAKIGLTPPWAVGDAWSDRMLVVWSPTQSETDPANVGQIRQHFRPDERLRCSLVVQRSGRFEPLCASRIEESWDDLRWLALPLEECGRLDGLEPASARRVLQSWILRAFPMAAANPFPCDAAVDGLHFAGRENELTRLGSGQPPFAFYGSRKCGKTSLYQEFARRMKGTSTLVAYVNVNNYARPPESALAKIAEVLRELPGVSTEARNVWRTPQATELVNVRDDEEARARTEAFATLLRSYVGQLGATQRLVLWLDEADAFLREDVSRLNRGARHQVGPVTWLFRDDFVGAEDPGIKGRIHIVFSGYTEVHRIAGRADPRTALYNFAPGGAHQLGVLPWDDAQQLVRRKFDWIGASIDDEALEFLVQHAAMHPMLLQSLCKLVVESIKEDAWRAERSAGRSIRITPNEVRRAIKSAEYRKRVTSLLASNFLVDKRLEAVYHAVLLHHWRQLDSRSPTRSFTEAQIGELLTEAATRDQIQWSQSLQDRFPRGMVEVLLDELCALGLVERLEVSGPLTYQVTNPVIVTLWGEWNQNAFERRLSELLTELVVNTELVRPRTPRAHPLPLHSNDEVVLAGPPQRLVFLLAAPGSGLSSVCRQITRLQGRVHLTDIANTAELCREVAVALTGEEVPFNGAKEWVRALERKLGPATTRARPMVVVERIDELCRDGAFSQLLEAWAGSSLRATLVLAGNGGLARMTARTHRTGLELPSSWTITLRHYAADEVALLLDSWRLHEVRPEAARDLHKGTRGRHRFVFSFSRWVQTRHGVDLRRTAAPEVTSDDVAGFLRDLDDVLTNSTVKAPPKWDPSFWEDLHGRWDQVTFDCLVRVTDTLEADDHVEAHSPVFAAMHEGQQSGVDWEEELAILLRLNVFLGEPGKHLGPEQDDPFWRAVKRAATFEERT